MFDSKSRSEESTLEVFFVDNSENTGKIYQYGFALQNDEVVEEWFYSKAKTARNRYKTIFYRKKGEELEVNGLLKSSIENIKVALEKETLIVSLGAKPVSYTHLDAEMKRAAFEKADIGITTNEMTSWQKNDDLLSWLTSLGQK